MKNLFLIALGLMLSFSASSQILKPVKWSYLAKKTSKTEATLLIRATIDNGWHIYSQTVPDGGPIKTSFIFKPAKAFSLIGKTVEPKPISKFEKTFDMNVAFFEKTVTFQQKVKLNKGAKAVKGKVEFGVCDDSKCLPPTEVEFSVPIK